MAIYYVYIIEKQTLLGAHVEYLNTEGTVNEYQVENINAQVEALVDVGFYYFPRLVYRKV